MNAREKAAKEALAAKRYDGGRTAFHVTKKGAKDVDSAVHDGGHKEGIIRSISGTIGGLKRTTR